MKKHGGDKWGESQVYGVNGTGGHTTRPLCALKSHNWKTGFFGHTTGLLVHAGHKPHMSKFWHLKPNVKNTGGFLQNYVSTSALLQRKTDWHVGFVTCVHQKSSYVTKKSRSPVVWLKCNELCDRRCHLLLEWASILVLLVCLLQTVLHYGCRQHIFRPLVPVDSTSRRSLGLLDMVTWSNYLNTGLAVSP